MTERLSLPGNWRLEGQRYRLEGEKCLNIDSETGKICKTFIFPPRDICPECGGEVKVNSSGGDIYNSDWIKEILDKTIAQEKEE